MIIFDLDGTLTLCDHRRHFVDPSLRSDCYFHSPATLNQSEGWYYSDVFLMCEPPKAKKFIPDWDAFYEACDKDLPNTPIIQVFWSLAVSDFDIEIWSGRSESVKDKTISWISKHIAFFYLDYCKLKMRPIGDYTPDDQLKEKWLDEAIANGKTIEMVFDDRKKVVDLWRRRRITCLQVAEGEF